MHTTHAARTALAALYFSRRPVTRVRARPLVSKGVVSNSRGRANIPRNMLASTTRAGASSGRRKMMVAPLWGTASRHDGPVVVSTARHFGKRVQSPTASQATNRVFAFVGGRRAPVSRSRDFVTSPTSTHPAESPPPISIAGPVCWLDPRMRSSLSQTFGALKTLSATVEEPEAEAETEEEEAGHAAIEGVVARHQHGAGAQSLTVRRTNRRDSPPDAWRMRSAPIEGRALSHRRPSQRASIHLTTIAEDEDDEEMEEACA